MVKAFHRAGIEVILDVVYNHTGEGNHLGPTLCFRGIDNAAYYRLDPERPAATTWTTPAAATRLEHAPPAHAPADHGQPALLGRGDARGRLPLRSRPRAGAGAARGRPRWRRSSTSCTRIPVLSAGEAHRRALGPGPGRLPGRATSRSAGREWNGKYRDTVRRFWRGDAGQVGRAGLPAGRQQRPLRAGGRAARMPASTSSPATTASPCTTWSATSASTTRPTARTTGTAPTTTMSRNWGVEGPTDSRRTSCAMRERMQAQLPGHARLLAGRADAARTATRSAAPSRATTTPTARTTRSPGWTGGSRRCRQRAPGVHPGRLRHPRRATRASPAHLFSPRAGRAGRGQGPHLAARRRTGDDAETIGTTPRTTCSAC